MGSIQQQSADNIEARMRALNAAPGALQEYREVFKEYTESKYETALSSAKDSVALLETTQEAALTAAQAFKDTLGQYIVTAANVVANDPTYQRKTYFLHAAQENLDEFNAYATLWLWANAVVFVKIMFVEQQQFFSLAAWTMLLLIFFLPAILTKLVRWGSGLPARVNIYSTWLEQKDPEWHGARTYFLDVDAVGDATVITNEVPVKKEKQEGPGKEFGEFMGALFK
jgi:hypothetical protein